MNLNYYYKRGYYKWLEDFTIDNSKIISANKELTKHKYKKSKEQIELCDNGQCFSLTTVYPGLLMGLGESHQTQKDKDELKLGYSFDYTTGMPYILASGIKGMLRSVFHLYPEYIAEYCEYVATIKNKFIKLNRKPEDVVEEIESEIFSGGGDIFFSAIPHQIKEDGHLIGIDYITPHIAEDEEMNGLKSPDVISMIKVMPEVSYVFRFILTDGIYLDGKEKLELFKQILLDFGIGAKTNVGFGILEETIKDKETMTYYHLMVKLDGICKKCGGETQTNPHTNLQSSICQKCYAEMKNNKTEVASNNEKKKKEKKKNG